MKVKSSKSRHDRKKVTKRAGEEGRRGGYATGTREVGEGGLSNSNTCAHFFLATECRTRHCNVKRMTWQPRARHGSSQFPTAAYYYSTLTLFVAFVLTNSVNKGC